MKNYFIAALIAIVGVNILTTSSSPFSSMFGLGLLAWAAWLALKTIKKGRGSAESHPLQDKIAAFNYSHFHADSGIAVDPAKRELHLLSKGEHKIYPFSMIRKWETNIMTGGMTRYAPNMTAGLVATAENARQRRENMANTGLFVDVKDVDHPRWHIEFHPKDVQRQLERWMEILRQELNES